MRSTPDQRRRVDGRIAGGEIVVRGAGSELGMTVTGWGAGSEALSAPITSRRTELVRDGLVEAWEQGPDGLAQSFTVSTPPDGVLVVALALRGATARVDADGRSASLFPAAGNGWRYEGLAAWDATGRDLPARMEASPDGLRLMVDATAAVGPVTIDPILVGVTWSVTSNDEFANLGASVASAGDVNGDGFEDLIAGAPYADGTSAVVGMAQVYFGSALGPATTPGWVARGSQAASYFGTSVSGVGDVNGDGFDDVVVGASGQNDGQQDEGAAFLFLGSPTGPLAAPSWAAYGDQASAFFGGAVAAAGDVNGDGFDDVVVGAQHYDAGQTDEGRAWLFLGSAAGLGAVAAWTAEGNSANARFGESIASAGDLNGDGFDDLVVGAYGDNGFAGRAAVYLGSAAGLGVAAAWSRQGQPNAFYGSAVAGVGDVDGDGFADLAVSSLAVGVSTGRIEVFRGSAAGLPAAPTWTVSGTQQGSEYGDALAGAGDVDGDGYGDLLVGAPRHDGEGAAFLYRGSSAGPAASPAASWTGAPDNSFYGRSVASADVDGDGWTDLLVGAPEFADGEDDEGAVFVYAAALADADADGVVDGQDVCPSMPDPAQLDLDGDVIGNACDAPWLEVSGVVSAGGTVSLVASGLNPGETVNFGAAGGAGAAGPCLPSLGGLCLDLGAGAVALGSAVADASGEATRSVAVPATLQAGGTYVVQAVVARGVGGADSAKSLLLVLDPTVIDWDADGLTDALEDWVGTDPTDPDHDGDGLLDGAELTPHLDPRLDDTDGDGVLDGADACLFGDDAVDVDLDAVADACDNCPSDPNPGQADGDQDGLGNTCQGAVLVTSGFSVDLTQVDAAWTHAAAAGDVNADGFDDLLLGAEGWDGVRPDQGVAVLFLGSAAGLLPAPAWSVLGDDGYDELGPVAGAGDLNGDGYADIVVGAPNALTRGWVGVWFGSATGLAVAPDWTFDGPTNGGLVGADVSAAGDVNGDGFDDLLIGAPGLDDGRSAEGKALLFLGSPGGPSLLPDWVTVGGQADAGHGSAVAAAGDLNGDGHDDVVIGAPRYDRGQQDEGLARVYFGSPTGPSTTAGWQAEGGAWLAGMGQRVGPAGDVDGDGFDDLLVGNPFDGNIIEDYGFVRLYLGSSMGIRPSPAWSAAGDYGFEGGYGYPDNQGSRLASVGAGDLNGDGFDELLIGEPGDDSNRTDGGSAWVLLGAGEGPAAQAAWTTTGRSTRIELGAVVAAAGDVNGDGLDDVVVATGRPGNSTAELHLGARP